MLQIFISEFLDQIKKFDENLRGYIKTTDVLVLAYERSMNSQQFLNLNHQ